MTETKPTKSVFVSNFASFFVSCSFKRKLSLQKNFKATIIKKFY